jgi:hypothetical protein
LTHIFLAHAEADQKFASVFSEFLTFGCNVICSPEEGRIGPGQTLLEKAEEGLAADVLILLLSPASWPERVPRQQWESVLFQAAGEAGVEVVSLLLASCPFPPLLARTNFFDVVAAGPLTAMRAVKRWLWQREQRATHSLNTAFSPDLEELYAALADTAGTLQTSGEEASRFAKEAGQEFEAVLWVACHNRSLAQVAGELGAQLGLTLDGPVEQNCRRILDLLMTRRCLLVLDAPAPEIACELISPGRTSTLVTREPVKILETPESMAHARKLIGARRYAEAYEILYRLLDSGISVADCAHELSWICEHWNRAEEAESLRFHYRLPPTEQLSLF